MSSTRERILDAAVERIASDGIDAVRIARIAMDARVSTALVHYHFATREALLAEALVHSFDRAGDTRTTGEGRLRDMIEQCLPLPARRPPPRAAPDRGQALRAHARVVRQRDRAGRVR